MRKILSAVLIGGLILAGPALADIKYTSDIEVVKGPSITTTDGNFYVAYADKDKDILFGKVKLVTAGGQVIVWQTSADIMYTTNDKPDCGFLWDKLILAFTTEDDDVKIVLFNTDFNLVGTTEYSPSAEYGPSVAGWDDYVVNTWLSSKKPGVTLIGSNIDQIGAYNNLCDIRYNELEAKSEASLDIFGDLATVVWRGDKDKIHITCFALQYTGGEINVIGYHDTELEEKTKLAPACTYSANGELCVVWASEDTNYIFMNTFNVSSTADASSVRKETITVDGCKGVDVCITGGKTYIAYANEDGLLTISKF